MTLERARLVYNELSHTPVDQVSVYSLFNCAEAFLKEIDRLKQFEEWYENRDWNEN